MKQSKSIYYVKTNRQDWQYGGKPTDWDNFPLDASQDFATFTKNQLYWKNLKEGDIIIGHSSYISSNIRDKYGKPKTKFTPLPRISAIAIVEKEEHYSKKWKCDAVTLKKIVGLNPIRLTNDTKGALKNAEPFRLGTNRCTITKLNREEYQEIIKYIQRDNSNIELELKKYNLHPNQLD